MPVWHLSTPDDSQLTIFPDETSRRAAVRRLARLSKARIALFSLVDSHFHVASLGERAEAGRLCQAINLALKPLAAGKLGPAHITPVKTRSHLRSLVRYFVQQVVHHGLSHHPALWSGSCFQDLIDARVIIGFQLRITELLPRLRPGQICEYVGLHEVPTPATDEQIRTAGPVRLVEAVTAALAVGPALRNQAPLVVLAKRAVVQLALKAGLALSELSTLLAASKRSIRRFAGQPVPSEVLAPIRRQVALRELVQAQALHALLPPSRPGRACGPQKQGWGGG